MKGYVYAVECYGRIKIGFSEDPEKRFNKIASDAPFPCDLLGYWPGTKADELSAHQKFSRLRKHGEWFKASDELLHFISAMSVNPTIKETGYVDLCGVSVPRGTKKRVADALGITHGAISQWGRVPIDRVADVSRVTGIPPQELRPDLAAIFGPAPRPTKEAAE